MRDSILAVGAPSESDGTISSGAAYLYRLSDTGWVLQQRLAGAVSDQRFGHAVALEVASDGTFLYVGAPGTSSVYIYKEIDRRWQSIGTLNRSSQSFFGRSVDTDDRKVAIGAPGEAPQGAIFLYARTGESFGLLARLDDPSSVLFLGDDLSLSGDRVAAGTTWTEPTTARVYVFRNEGAVWAPEAAFAAPASVVTGGTVRVDGDWLLLETDDESILVYTFSDGEWSSSTRIDNPAITPSCFGCAFDMSGGLVAAVSSNGLYVFRNNGIDWPLVADIPVTGLATNDQAISIDGERLAAAIRSDPEVVSVYDLNEVLVGGYVPEPREAPDLLPTPFPNPSFDRTAIEYNVNHPSHVRLIASDILGRTVQILTDSFHSSGQYRLDWSANHLSSGTYILVLTTEDSRIERPVVLVR